VHNVGCFLLLSRDAPVTAHLPKLTQAQQTSQSEKQGEAKLQAIDIERAKTAPLSQNSKMRQSSWSRSTGSLP
jgi:hypothetical protein